MPTFEITAPDGAIYDIEGADERGALAALQTHLAGAPREPLPGEGAAKQFGVGVAKGLIQTAGAPFDFAQQAVRAGVHAGDYVRQKIGLDPIPPDVLAQYDAPAPGTSAYTQGQIEKFTGPFRKPENVGEEYAQTAGEFAPSVVMGTGGPIAKAAQWLVPALTSETAGQVARQAAPAYEGAARLAGGLVGGGASTAGVRPTAPEVVRQAIPRNITPEQWTAAERLVQGGATADEAFNAVTGGGARQMSGAMRVASNAPEGAAITDPFYAQRAQRNIAEAQMAIDPIKPNISPEQRGIVARDAAEGVLTDTRQAINAAEGPYYEAARAKTVPLDDLREIAADPAFQQALKSVRGDAIRNKDVAHLQANDVPTLIAVRKELSRMEGNALKPGMGLNPDAELARNITPVRDQLDQIITKTAPEYGQALGIGAGLRETQLEPLKVGPIGDISKTTDVGQQAAAIFPAEPRADFHTVAAQSVRRLAAKNPQAAEALAYDYLKTSLDQAATRFKTVGEDTNVGAGFAARVAGTPETTKVLQGVMKALPSGQQRWEGLNKILEVFQAQQFRPTMGSPTAPIQNMQRALRKGPAAAEFATEASRLGTTIPGRLREAAQDFWYGRNTAGIASILTDPNAIPLLRELAKHPATSDRAQALVLRLVNVGAQTAPRGPLVVDVNKPR